MSQIKEYFPFAIPFYHVTISDWLRKKPILMNFVDWNDPECITDEHFTDYHKNLKNPPDGRPKYTVDFINLFSNELVTFANKHQMNVNITSLWAQRYYKTHHMQPHTHGLSGFSAVLYADFSQKDMGATVFQAPFKNPVHGNDLSHQPKVKEGDMIIFPSTINHWAMPNISDKPRTIFSFNCQLASE